MLTTWYRRRFTDGRATLMHYHGPARILRDDSEVLVFDWAMSSAHPLRTVAGWEPGSPRARLADVYAYRAYNRSWWWRTLPICVNQIYDTSGTLLVNRIDFATPAITYERGIYQTDIFLDCFIGADGSAWLIEDADELEDARELGIVSAELAIFAEQTCAEIVERARTGTWYAWLQSLVDVPFDARLVPSGRSYRFYWLGFEDLWPEDRDD